jgi:hypothetical protein
MLRNTPFKDHDTLSPDALPPDTLPPDTPFDSPVLARYTQPPRRKSMNQVACHSHFHLPITNR